MKKEYVEFIEAKHKMCEENDSFQPTEYSKYDVKKCLRDAQHLPSVAEVAAPRSIKSRRNIRRIRIVKAEGLGTDRFEADFLVRLLFKPQTLGALVGLFLGFAIDYHSGRGIVRDGGGRFFIHFDIGRGCRR